MKPLVLLGQSDRFVAFLQAPSEEAGGTPLAEIRKERGYRVPGTRFARTRSSWGSIA